MANSRSTRRDFLRDASLSGAGLAALTLRAGAGPTPNSPDAAEAEAILRELGEPPRFEAVLDPARGPTDPRELGPFYRPGAPYRAKICPPREPGTALVVSGRIWGYDTRKPLAGALLDIWQVDNQRGTYSRGDGEYKNRARLVASETGYYEFETVHPVPYQPNKSNTNFWRSPHIHFIATAPGYKRLVSEMFFAGDDKHDIDPLFLASLMVKPGKAGADGGEFETAEFDIVLEK